MPFNTLMLARKLWFSQKEEGVWFDFLQFISYQSVWEVDNTKTTYGVTPTTEQKTPTSLKILWCRSLLLLTDECNACEQQGTDHIYLPYSQLQGRERNLQASIKKSLHQLNIEILQMLLHNRRRECFLDILRSLLCTCRHATGWQNCYSKLRWVDTVERLQLVISKEKSFRK